MVHIGANNTIDLAIREHSMVKDLKISLLGEEYMISIIIL